MKAKSFCAAVVVMLALAYGSFAQEVSMDPEEDILLPEPFEAVRNEPEGSPEEEMTMEEELQETDEAAEEEAVDAGAADPEEPAEPTETSLFTDESGAEFTDELPEMEPMQLEISVCADPYLYRRDGLFFLRIVSENRGYTREIAAGESVSLEVPPDVYQVFLMQAKGFSIEEIRADAVGYDPLGMPGGSGNTAILSPENGGSCCFILESERTRRSISWDYGRI